MIDKIERILKHFYSIAIILILLGFVGIIGYAVYKFEGKHLFNHSEVHNYYTNKVYDSTKKEIKIKEIPGPVQIIHDTIPQKVDTLKILSDYYSEKIFENSLGDSSFKAKITSRVKNNSLVGMEFQYQILRPTIIQDKPKNKLFIGGDLGANRTGFTYLGPRATVISKQDNLYSTGYNFIDNSFIVGAGFKIGKK